MSHLLVLITLLIISVSVSIQLNTNSIELNTRQEQQLHNDDNNNEYENRLIRLRSEIRKNGLYKRRINNEHYTKDLQTCEEFEGSASMESQPWSNSRLPTNVIPSSYVIDLDIPLDESGVYVGFSLINVYVKEPLDTFIIHAKLLAIEQIAINSTLNSTLALKCFGYYVKNDYFIIKTQSLIQPGNYTIDLLFGGFLFLFESGLAELNYDSTNSKQKYVVSHFEPVDARKAFPCFDEPEYKAKFTFVIAHPNNTHVLSNMPSIRSENTISSRAYYTTTLFETSIALPTYLIALAILPKNDFQLSSAMSNIKNVNISLWTQTRYYKDNNTTSSTLAMILDLFNTLEELFDVRGITKYPNKIDILVVPEYLDDAVSHYGLCIFKENKILFSNTSVSQLSKQRIALLIAKQLSKIWFGNVISIKWWNDLWLQEGLSDSFKYKLVSATYPEWRISEQFVSEELIHVLVSDAFQVSRAIIKNVTNSFEIDQLFDDTQTKSKVACVLRMIEYEIDVDLVEYIQELEESGYAVPEQIFFDIGLIEQWNASDFFARWFLQPNYPLISVRLRRLNNTNYAHFIQDRYLNTDYTLDDLNLFDASLSSSLLSSASLYNWTWYVPLKCVFGTSINDTNPQTQRFNLIKKDEFLELNIQDVNYTWIHCNSDFVGLYEMDYSIENWKQLGRLLKATLNTTTTTTTTSNEIFKPLDRANIIHNLFMNAYNERERYADLVDILTYLHYERDLIVWKVVQKHLYDLIDIFEYRSTFYAIAKFFNNELREIEQELDVWSEASTHEDGLLKETILEMACRLQDLKYLQEATQKWSLVDAYFNNNNNDDDDQTIQIPAHARAIVYNYHLQNTYNVRDWDSVSLNYKAINDVQEQQRFLQSLTYTRLTWLQAQFIENVEKLKYKDFFEGLSLLARQPLGRDIAWSFFRENYASIILAYSLDDVDVGQLIYDLVKTFDNQFLYRELFEFLNTTTSTSTTSGAQLNLRLRALERVATTIAWLADKETEIQVAFSTPRVIV